MKTRLFLLILLLLIFSTACSKEKEATPNDFFDAYVNEWNKEDFAKMYSMLSTETINDYPAEEFVDRYIKIYEDLNITDLKVTYEKMNDEENELALEEEQATLPFKVEMESVAGPISFNYQATLVKENNDEENDEAKWALHWDPGFIFPAIKEGGKINFQTTKPTRGEILDRNQMPLAINDVVYEIGIVPEKMGDNEDVIKKEVSTLLNMSVESIDAALNANWVKPDQFVPLKKVPKTKEKLLNQLWNIESVMGDEVEGRSYPLGKAAAHLVGYIGQINAEELEKQEPDVYDANDVIGKRGLEQLFEERLKGEKGLRITVSSEGEEDVILAEKPVKHGENISLTIDANVQEEIYDSYGTESGTAAAINPKTGETLALVSSPAFDPNDLLYGISSAEWEELQNDPKTPFINRFAATFAPGSVIKPVTAAIGLENGSIVAEEGIEIKGDTWSNGKGWGDYKVRRVSTSTKPVDLADALKRSDNIYFAMKAVDMGIDPFISGLKQFGFEEDLPFEYPIVPSTISSSGTLSGEVELANSSYGQAQMEVSPLQIALAYTPFLNDGNLMKPSILTTTETGQIWHENVISRENAQLIQDILQDVVAEGTAKAAKREELAISGKTGTAELKKTGGKRGHENGWFVGYPTEEQNILIAMVVEHAEDIGTSSYTAEKVADILVKLKNELDLN